MIALSSSTLAGSVIVTGFGGFLPRWFSPRSMEIVTALAAAGTFSLAGTAGCQVTCASTRIAVLPPSCTTVTASSRESRTPVMSGSENMSYQIESLPTAPVSVPVPPKEYRCDTCFASHASTCCGLPGASHQSALTTRSGVAGIWIEVLSAPESTDGAAASLRAPDGTANEARMASASATARCFGPAAGRGFDRVEVTVVPVDPVVWPAGCATAHPASAMAATAPRAAPA